MGLMRHYHCRHVEPHAAACETKMMDGSGVVHPFLPLYACSECYLYIQKPKTITQPNNTFIFSLSDLYLSF